MKERIKEAVADIQRKYDTILLEQNPQTLEKAFEYVKKKKQMLKDNQDTSSLTLDADTKLIFDLMEKFQQEIKQVYMESGESITHTTDISPEDMNGGMIATSVNRANMYESDRGNWVFASSAPIATNAYIARKVKGGMASIRRANAYIYGGDNMEIKQNEQGQNRVMLKKPNYVYKINPEGFTPVVALSVDEQRNPFFAFSDEWTSENDVNINDPTQVRSVEKIQDITMLVESCQIFTCDDIQRDFLELMSDQRGEGFLNSMLKAVNCGRLRYINGEANINVSPFIQNSKLVTDIGKATGNVPLEKKNYAEHKIQQDEQTLQPDRKNVR